MVRGHDKCIRRVSDVNHLHAIYAHINKTNNKRRYFPNRSSTVRLIVREGDECDILTKNRCRTPQKLIIIFSFFKYFKCLSHSHN